MIKPLTLAEVQALPDTEPWHVAACHSHVPGGQRYRPGEPAPTCVAVRDEAGRPVERPRAVLDLQAAAPALRETALALFSDVVRWQEEASNAFGEQIRAEGERDAARRELAEIRFALGAIADGLPLGKVAGDLALFAAQTAERLMTVSAERDRLRAEAAQAGLRIVITPPKCPETDADWMWSLEQRSWASVACGIEKTEVAARARAESTFRWQRAADGTLGAALPTVPTTSGTLEWRDGRPVRPDGRGTT